MPDRRVAWRQPLPARRPGCVPVPDPALRGQAGGTDHDDHDDVEQQLQRGSRASPQLENAIEAAAGMAVTEMNTPIRALARARRQRWAHRAPLTVPCASPPPTLTCTPAAWHPETAGANRSESERASGPPVRQ